MRTFSPIIFTLLLLISYQALKSQAPCEVTTFQKVYGISNDVDHAEEIVETPDHGFITGGRSAINNWNTLIMKVDRMGNVVWARQQTGLNTPRGILKLFRRLKDGNYLTVGYTFGNNINTWIIKFDENGNIIWNKQLNNPNYGNNPADVCELPDGSLILVGGYATMPNYGAAYTIKLDANGNIIWSKGLQSTYFQGGFALRNLLFSNGTLYATGISEDHLGGVVAKINPLDGSFTALTTIKIDNLRTEFFDIAEKNNKLYITASSRDQPNWLLKEMVVIINPDLSIAKIYKLDFGYNRIFDFPAMWAGDDEGFVIASSSEDYADVALTKITEDGVIKWSKEYPKPGSQVIYDIKPTADKGMVVLVQTSTDESSSPVPPQDILLIKTDGKGIAADCPVRDRPVTITTPPYIKTQESTAYVDVTFTLTSYAIDNVPISMPARSLCEKVITPACTVLQITGKDTVCKFSDHVTYNLVKNNGCILPVNWTVDNNYVQVISTSDNNITVKFKKSGETMIKASISEMCNGISSDHSTVIMESPASLNLGPDKPVCANNTIMLRSGPGFKDYKWQDGSTSPDLLVRNPGKYYVTASDFCNNVFTDTVIINPAPAPVDFLPADTAICKGYETVLAPLSGFDKYLWSTGETTKQITVILPGTYSLTATNAYGCSTTEDVIVGEKNDCITALYIPSAFSPNSDGRNELFKGTAYGLLKKFHLTVFNRYGNIVFESRDINKGWDGKLGGLAQDTGNFVWVCEYQFLGRDAEMRKGHVILIR